MVLSMLNGSMPDIRSVLLEDPAMTRLRQRMIRAMQLQQFSSRTINYVGTVLGPESLNVLLFCPFLRRRA